MNDMAKHIYFDYASTTPTDPDVIRAMTPYFHEKFGNPSSSHSFGQEAQKALEQARETVAGFLGARPDEVVFNSGATEANNHAMFGAVRGRRDKALHLIISGIEHHSVHEPAVYLEKEGFSVTYLPVDENGRVAPEDVRASVRPDTVLIAVMLASNEIGTIQPVEEIGRMAREHGILFLVDAVQAVGHIPVDVQALGADLLSLSGHKFYGPKGIGALYIRKGTKIAPFLLGGDQERGRRASTQNVAGALGLAKAVEICQAKMSEEMAQQKAWRDRLLTEIPKRVEGVRVNGHLQERLPNNAHFSFEGVQGESLLMSLDMRGICASMGSACTAGAMAPSHVLKAIGLSDELALGALRVTLGRWTKEEDIDKLLEELPGIVTSLRV